VRFRLVVRAVLAWRAVLRSGSRGRRTSSRTIQPRAHGAAVASAYLSILGLTLTNPMTILSLGALFAGLGVTGDDMTGAALITIGVLLGSAAWWVLLVSIVSVVRGRVTTTWIRRINVASGVAIGGFAIVSIASVVL
jgi:threonine/homoserine/homoserine lactone efflux protein